MRTFQLCIDSKPNFAPKSELGCKNSALKLLDNVENRDTIIFKLSYQ